MHRSHVFLGLLLSFIGGIFLGSFLTIPQNIIWIAIIICVITITVFFRKDSRLLNPRIALIAFFGLFFLFGIVRFNASYLKQHLLKEFARASAEIKDSTGKYKIKVDLYGYVDDQPARGGDKQQIVFHSEELEINGKMLTTDENILIIVKAYPEYNYGQTLKVNGELKLHQNFSDSGFDYVEYLSKNNVFTLMSYPVISKTDLKLSFFKRVKISIYKKIFAVKNAFESSINRSVQEPNAAYINGILLGTRSQIPQDLKDAFARTSTSHILAISGFNITIIAGILTLIFILFLKRPTAFLFSVIGITLFTLLTGAQASVVRAAIMGCLVLLANKEGRLYGAVNAIIFAGAAMVLINPNILRYDAGFQLSFMATLGLIYLGPIFKNIFAKLPNFLNLPETLAMTISAQIAVLPLLLFYFKQLSVISLPANILILPFVPLSMLLGFLTGLAGLITPFLGTIIGYFAWFLTSIQLFLVKFLAKPGWATIPINFPWYLLVVVYIIGIYIFWKLTVSKKFTA